MKYNLVLFGLGAFAYGLIEVIWRGYSHWTMMIAGGLCLIIFAKINEKLKNTPLIYKCILGSLTVSLIELAFGSFFNLYLGLEIWDYSNLPINLFGQVSLVYSVLWGYLCIIAIPFASAVKRRLIKEETSYEISSQSVGGN